MQYKSLRLSPPSQRGLSWVGAHQQSTRPSGFRGTPIADAFGSPDRRSVGALGSPLVERDGRIRLDKGARFLAREPFFKTSRFVVHSHQQSREIRESQL